MTSKSWVQLQFEICFYMSWLSTSEFKKHHLPVAPFQGLTDMPPEGSKRAGILLGCPSLDRGRPHHSRLNGRPPVLVQSFRSAYPMAVPGFEPRTSGVRGERVTTTTPTHVGRI
ncbi:hypothetical protein T265_09272 [Opisthorchis viverrini]|uniref:Uncharacterized protein n=1 Tax=Opisthorchis viverrini TaxID=6198 RepID=A0A074Z6C3_OPIVI|nr:hypothetical protein T265_09272 [Opisthorchis viverrini]KER22681.1 hypothetical protein T265_09272 [Opisthorchis viverrini]